MIRHLEYDPDSVFLCGVKNVSFSRYFSFVFFGRPSGECQFWIPECTSWLMGRDSTVRRLRGWEPGGRIYLYSEREVLKSGLCDGKNDKRIKGKKEDHAEGAFGENWRE